MSENRGAALLGLGLATGFIIWVSRPLFNRYGVFARSALIDPESVADVAASLPQDEDSFILSAWDLVGQQIQYSNYGSILYFSGDVVKCQRCLLASEVLNLKRGNCVAKATLLTSLLRNRLPANRVYMAVGWARLDGLGGHAWCEVERNGTWYILESTMPPPAMPWVPADAMSKVYIPQALVNDQDLVCYSSEVCSVIEKANCLCEIERLFAPAY